MVWRSSWDLNNESDRSEKYLRNNSLITFGRLFLTFKNSRVLSKLGTRPVLMPQGDGTERDRPLLEPVSRKLRMATPTAA